MSTMYSLDPSLPVEQIIKELVNAGSPISVAVQSANHWHRWWLANHK